MATLQTSDGREVLIVPPEVIAAFKVFLGEEKRAGSLIVSFKNGGVAGVETNTKQVLK
jgi:hypothetical protein